MLCEALFTLPVKAHGVKCRGRPPAHDAASLSGGNVCQWLCSAAPVVFITGGFELNSLRLWLRIESAGSLMWGTNFTLHCRSITTLPPAGTG